jgi:hypothetical protein
MQEGFRQKRNNNNVPVQRCHKHRNTRIARISHFITALSLCPELRELRSRCLDFFAPTWFAWKPLCPLAFPLRGSPPDPLRYIVRRQGCSYCYGKRSRLRDSRENTGTPVVVTIYHRRERIVGPFYSRVCSIGSELREMKDAPFFYGREQSSCGWNEWYVLITLSYQ